MVCGYINLFNKKKFGLRIIKTMIWYAVQSFAKIILAINLGLKKKVFVSCIGLRKKG